MKKILSLRNICVFLFIVAILGVKYIYLHTAESGVDIEELPLPPLNAIAHGVGRVDFADTRLYGFNYITNYIFLYLFGYSVESLKLTSLVFFLAACLAVFSVSRSWFQGQDGWLKYLPVSLLAFGPPVAQMWALKNRGGFIETIAIFAIMVWLYQRWISRPTRTDCVYALGVLGGIAIWAQPISLVFVVPVFAGLVWETFRDGWRPVAVITARFGAASIVGAMPLIALNFLYNFNTFKVIAGGEGGLGADTPLARFVRLFLEGIPRLLGLKQQWYSAWVLGSWFSVVALIIFLVLFSTALFYVLKKFFGSRRFDETIVLVASLGLLLLGNVVASWGAFQEEPRRLLLAYIPLVLLGVLGLARSPRLLLVFCGLWFTVSTVSNVRYVAANRHGFSSPLYRSYREAADFLRSHGISHVYVNIWQGAKLSFDSGMTISWSAVPYLPSGSGFYSDNNFSPHDAAAFFVPQAGAAEAAEKMRSDLDSMGIDCVVAKKDSFIFIYACSRSFNIRRLSRSADQLRRFAAQGVVFDSSTYASGSFEDLYSSEGAITWSKPRVVLPLVPGHDSSGLLCIVVGPQRKMVSKDVFVTLGRSILPSIIAYSDDKETAFTFQSIDAQPELDSLSISVPAFIPAKAGSRDSRSLGLPLRSVRFVRAISECR